MLVPFRVTATLTSLVILSACGGGGSTAFEKFQTRLENDAETGSRLFQTPGTAWASMPLAGSADYNGSAAIFIDPVYQTDSDDILIIGDTHLTANFGAGTMTGRIDNMTAATNMTETDADIYGVSGQIGIGGAGSIIGDDEDDNFTNLPNEWRADYYGNIGFNGNSYEVEGSIDGRFVGTRANPAQGQSPARGVIGVSENGFATINGQYETNEAFVSMELYGEN